MPRNGYRSQGNFLDNFSGVDVDLRGTHGRISIGQFDPSASPSTWPGAVLLKRLGEGRGMGQDECVAVIAGMREYANSVLSLPIRTPKVYSRQPVLQGLEYQVWIAEEYIRGETFSDLWTSKRHTLEYKSIFVGKLLSILSAIPEIDGSLTLAGVKMKYLRVGLDLKPANIVVADSTDVVLVDTYPPVNMSVDGIRGYDPRIYRFGHAKLAAVCGTRVGIALRLWWLLRESAERNDRWNVDQMFRDQLARELVPESDATAVLNQATAGFPLLRLLYP